MFGKLTLNNAASFRSFSTEEISQIEIWKNIDPKNVDGEIWKIVRFNGRNLIKYLIFLEIVLYADFDTSKNLSGF